MKAILIVGCVIGLAFFVFLYYVINDDARRGIVPKATEANIVTIISHYQSGVHQYSGSIRLPHSCYLLEREAKLDPANPSVVRLNITTTDKGGNKQTCLMLPTQYSFDILFEGPESLTPRLYINGAPTPIHVINQPLETGGINRSKSDILAN